MVVGLPHNNTYVNRQKNPVLLMLSQGSDLKYDQTLLPFWKRPARCVNPFLSTRLENRQTQLNFTSLKR